MTSLERGTGPHKALRNPCSPHDSSSTSSCAITEALPTQGHPLLPFLGPSFGLGTSPLLAVPPPHHHTVLVPMPTWLGTAQSRCLSIC